MSKAFAEGRRGACREYLLNTRAASFFNFDWANKAALTYICEQCGHIMWFADDTEHGG